MIIIPDVFPDPVGRNSKGCSNDESQTGENTEQSTSEFGSERKTPKLFDRPLLPLQPANDPTEPGSHFKATNDLGSHEIGTFHVKNYGECKFDRRTGRVLCEPGASPIYRRRFDDCPLTLEFYPEYDQPFHAGLHDRELYATIHPNSQMARAKRKEGIIEGVIQLGQGLFGIVFILFVLGALLEGCVDGVNAYRKYREESTPWYKKVNDAFK